MKSHDGSLLKIGCSKARDEVHGEKWLVEDFNGGKGFSQF